MAKVERKMSSKTRTRNQFALGMRGRLDAMIEAATTAEANAHGNVLADRVVTRVARTLNNEGVAALVESWNAASATARAIFVEIVDRHRNTPLHYEEVDEALGEH